MSSSYPLAPEFSTCCMQITTFHPFAIHEHSSTFTIQVGCHIAELTGPAVLHAALEMVKAVSYSISDEDFAAGAEPIRTFITDQIDSETLLVAPAPTSARKVQVPVLTVFLYKLLQKMPLVTLEEILRAAEKDATLYAGTAYFTSSFTAAGDIARRLSPSQEPS